MKRAMKLKTTYHQLTLLLTLAFALSILLSACDINSVSKLNHAQAYEESEALLTWLEERVDLLVKHKADCSEMAQALVAHQKKHQEQINHWHKIAAGQMLANRALQDQALDRRLKKLILKGDLVHSYCAYQSNFRDLLKNQLE